MDELNPECVMCGDGATKQADDGEWICGDCEELLPSEEI
jgi:hypothetical protein